MAADVKREVKTLATKLDKRKYEIYMKIRVMCSGVIDVTNLQTVIITVMRELNKHISLAGFMKKEAAIQIIALILEDFGTPEIQAQTDAQIIESMIEQIYALGYHRFSTTKLKADGKCALL
jgi:hypothetical protein